MQEMRWINFNMGCFEIVDRFVNEIAPLVDKL